MKQLRNSKRIVLSEMSKAVVMQWTVATIEKLVKFHRGLSKEAFWTEERLILYVALYKPNVDLFFFSEHDGHFFLLDSPHYGRVEEKKRVFIARTKGHWRAISGIDGHHEVM